MDRSEQKFAKRNKPSELEILNPTMKELEKLEKDTIDENEPDILGDFRKEHEKDENKVVNFEIDNEEDEAFINRIHRLSKRKLEIGKMRSTLISTSFNKDKYVDEVNIDKERALKMADNIFKRRLKFINKKKGIDTDLPKYTSGNFQFSPQPFIKRLISRIDTEGNDINHQINEKRAEIIGNTDDYKNSVTKTEHNIESYANKNNNRTPRDTNVKEIKVNSNTNKKTLSNKNLNVNIKNVKANISNRGNRNNNHNLIQTENQNINLHNNRKAVENKDINGKGLRVMSQTNILGTNRISPQVINSPRITEAKTSRRNQSNITTEINISNIISSRSPRHANNIKVNTVTSATKTNVNQVPNTTRGNRGNNPSKITPIPLPLDKINKQSRNDQKENKTSRGYNRPNLSKPLEIEIQYNNNNHNRRNQNKVETNKSNIIQKTDNRAAINEPRRRNANNQTNVKQAQYLPVKTEVKNYPNTSRGNERNKIEIKNQATSNRRGNNQTGVKSPGKAENKKVVTTNITSGRRGKK